MESCEPAVSQLQLAAYHLYFLDQIEAIQLL